MNGLPPSLPCVLMRGGTSKAIFLWEEDLPAPGAERDRVISRVFGSPDVRQIDGLGGADPLTSKLAIIGRSAPEGADLSYTFGQVEIERPAVDYESLCGNITAAVGHFAVQERLTVLAEPVTRVKVFSTNLQRVLLVDVPVHDGLPQDEGELEIAGVPGVGAPIRVDLAATAGARTGEVLPTGRAAEEIDVPGYGPMRVSLVDTGNPHVFVLAADLGLSGAESVAELAGDADLAVRVEAIRAAGALRMGLVSPLGYPSTVSPAVPILGLVGPPQRYQTLMGADVAVGDHDLVARLFFMQRPHKAYAGTSTACTGVAARIAGTVVADVASMPGPRRDLVRIGHPSGVIETHTELEDGAAGLRVLSATVDRTARRLLAGTVYL